MVGLIPGVWSAVSGAGFADLGWGDAKSYVAPLMVVALVTPLVVVLLLLLVAGADDPALFQLVQPFICWSVRRGLFVLSLGWLGSVTVLALVAMVVHAAVLIPPLVLILPPLIC